ncbi:helix-turn-helix domain-containing protein [Microbacterium allomyrinae]|uniref:Helix-turn-helix transcriptional regulator n=1 Tax=Microbacterium allomyrinae TaxID=2830666 RepID=A0A9X1S3C3_9MICO|nr:helix-turn-helix transcriptional regulator [Microbacterium allomyrinae]MCC2031798.1 helix-turn-helix transcriptional regulator [Microbacterium allomyrinae]
MGELSGFSWRVIDVIQKLIEQKGMTDAELIVRSGVPRNTFYRKMRGETPLNTNDIDAIAAALDVDPFDLLRAAAAPNVTELHPRRRDVGAFQQDLQEVANESIDEDPVETDSDFDNA